jgi:hypothetical protein
LWLIQADWLDRVRGEIAPVQTPLSEEIALQHLASALYLGSKHIPFVHDKNDLRVQLPRFFPALMRARHAIPRIALAFSSQTRRRMQKFFLHLEISNC